MRAAVALLSLSLVLIAGAALAQVAPSAPPGLTPAADIKEGSITLVAGKKGRRFRHQRAETKSDAIKPDTTKPDTTKEAKTSKTAPTDPLTSCLQLWEPATHMSRHEWERACHRVDQRLKNVTLR
jgi:hypothetical protein